MFDELESNLKENIMKAIDDANEIGIHIYGSEVLLMALMKDQESLCYYILNQINISNEDILEIIKKYLLIRENNKIYTEKFLKILNDSFDISKKEKADYIYDEHIIYAILLDGNNLALEILKELKVNINNFFIEIENYFNESEPYLINLTNKIDNVVYIGGKYYIDKIIRILAKIKKNNCMVIGNAGVGKSSLIEAVVKRLKDMNSEYVVYKLDISTLMAGTKYRGDLEERIIEVIDKIKNSNVIVFIDEIHNIIHTGSSEGSLDIANILKPYLSNGDIRCIGATTLDEYYKYICKDQALARRFQNLFLDEANEIQTYNILLGIKDKYEKTHNVYYSKNILKYIVDTMYLIPNRKMPDKAIDILDEAGIVAKTKNRKMVNKDDVRQVTFEYLGIRKTNENNLKERIHYKNLYKYYNEYFLALGLRKNIMCIACKKENIDSLIKDFNKVFYIKKEAVLNLNLKEFNSTTDTTLFGASFGYVGYENGGILSEHILRYPISVIIISDYNTSNIKIQKQIETLITNGEIIDGKGRNIKAINSIFIFIESENNKSNIGFSKEISNENKIGFIEEYITTTDDYYYEIKKLINRMKQNDYYFYLKKNRINYKTYEKIKSCITNIELFKKNIKYEIIINNQEVQIKKFYTTRKKQKILNN